jgi:hypothetical protein
MPSFKQNSIYQHILLKLTNGIFHEGLFSVSRVLTCTDMKGRTESEPDMAKCFPIPLLMRSLCELWHIMGPFPVSWVTDKSAWDTN